MSEADDLFAELCDYVDSSADCEGTSDRISVGELCGADDARRVLDELRAKVRRYEEALDRLDRWAQSALSFGSEMDFVIRIVEEARR